MKNQSRIKFCDNLNHFRDVVLEIFSCYSTRSAITLCDSNTSTYCLPYFKDCIKSNTISSFTIPHGEKHKDFSTINSLIQWLLNQQIDRSGFLINIGGGVITDIGGFAASIYKRGISYINIPTTLIGMVDAAIGGKTGINVGGIKNQTGTFHMPDWVIIWPKFLDSLPKEEIISGLGELFKYSIIGAPFSMNDIPKEPSLKQISNLIYDAALYKENVVELDPKDNRERIILNFGHTIGHAIEAEAINNGEHLTHGEAVAAGVVAEAFVLQKRGFITTAFFSDIVKAYDRLFNPSKVHDFLSPKLLNWVAYDKKVSTGNVSLPLVPFIAGGNYKVDILIKELLLGVDFLLDRQNSLYEQS